MTISSTVAKNQYTANGAQTVFAYQFKVFAEAELEVYLGNVLQASGYSVSNVGNDNGGNVTFSVAPANATIVTLQRKPPLTQPLDLPTQGPFPSDSVEAQFDKLVMQAQYLKTLIDRSLLLAVSSTLTGIQFPAAEAGKAIGWNGTEDGLTNVEPSSGALASTYMATVLAAADAAAARTALGANANGSSIFATATAIGLALGTAATAATVRATAICAAGAGIFGLKLTNNGTDANNDIDIAAGECLDDTGAVVMRLAAAVTKRLDAAWVVGTNQGGLQAGQVDAGQKVYQVFLIYRNDTGVVDVLFSDETQSAVALPAGYTHKRRIGAIVNDVGSNLIQFAQLGDTFFLKTVNISISDNAIVGGTFKTGSLTCPPNSIARVAAQASYAGSVGGESAVIQIRPTGSTDSTGFWAVIHVNNSATPSNALSQTEVSVDASRQIQYTVLETGTQVGQANIAVLGFRLPDMSTGGS